MKLQIEINMDNDALKRDPIGEVMRMIKLGIRNTELQKDCTLYDINGQDVGTLKIIPDRDIPSRVYSKDDFEKDRYVAITCTDGRKYTDVKVVTVMSTYIRVRVGVGQVEHVSYKDMLTVFYREG